MNTVFILHLEHKLPITEKYVSQGHYCLSRHLIFYMCCAERINLEPNAYGFLVEKSSWIWLYEYIFIIQYATTNIGCPPGLFIFDQQWICITFVRIYRTGDVCIEKKIVSKFGRHWQMWHAQNVTPGTILMVNNTVHMYSYRINKINRMKFECHGRRMKAHTNLATEYSV